MWYVYVLISLKDRQLYFGFTNDLRSRYKAHVSGYVRATKHRRPVKLIHYEAYLEEKDARQRERYLKGGNGHQALKIQLKTTLTKNTYKHI